MQPTHSESDKLHSINNDAQNLNTNGDAEKVQTQQPQPTLDGRSQHSNLISGQPYQASYPYSPYPYYGYSSQFMG